MVRTRHKTFIRLSFFAVARPLPAVTVGPCMAPFDTGLAPTTAPDVALRHIVADCHADLRKYRAIVLQSRRPIGIHQTRV